MCGAWTQKCRCLPCSLPLTPGRHLKCLEEPKCSSRPESNPLQENTRATFYRTVPQSFVSQFTHIPKHRLYLTRGDISCALSNFDNAKCALDISRRGAKQDSESSCFDYHAHICCGLDGHSLGKLQWIQFNALEVRSQDLLELWTPS